MSMLKNCAGIILVGVMLSGCFKTVADYQNTPSVKLCMDYLVHGHKPLYFEGRTIEKVLAQRGENCSQYAGAATQLRIQDERSSQALGAMGTQLLKNSGPTPNPNNSYGSGGAATAFKTGETTKGFNKICMYDQMGSPVVITIGATELCPLTIP